MSGKEFFKKMFTKLGENNKPTYAVMAIAAVKGIARPLFTLSDKHTDPETKRYTAIREGLTEVVAIPTYFVCGELASKIGSGLKLPVEKQNLAKRNFMFLGVCTAALFIIPALASATIKPFMKKIQKDRIESQKLDIRENGINKTETKPVFRGKRGAITPYRNLDTTVMKAGSLW